MISRLLAAGPDPAETANRRETPDIEPRPADSPRSRGGAHADVSTSPTGEQPDGPADDDRVLDELLAELDLPGDARRVEAVRACVAYLREVGVASRSDFIDNVYPEHRTGVGDGRWWDVVGKQGLRQIADGHPSIEPPGSEGAHNYEWIGE